jgi:hypothetical protein
MTHDVDSQQLLPSPQLQKLLMVPAAFAEVLPTATFDYQNVADMVPNPTAARWRKLKANGVTHLPAEYRAVKAGTSKLSANLRRLVVEVYENE